MTKTAQPIHPGEHLSDIVEELGITQYGSCPRNAPGANGPVAKR